MNNYIYEGAVLAHLAYLDQIRNDILPSENVEYKEFNYEETKGFFLEGENQLSIAVEGTQSYKDWLANIFFENRWLPDFVSTNDPHNLVHTGFKLKAWAIQNNLMVRIYRAVQEGKLIHLAGHSSGAATVSFLAQGLLKEMPKAKIYLYSFGSPRLGDLEIYRDLMERCESCIFLSNRKDIVCHLPWSYPPNPYQILIESKGSSWIRPLKNHSINMYVAVAKLLVEKLDSSSQKES